MANSEENLRKYPKNFTLRKYVYQILLKIMEDNGFKATSENEDLIYIYKKFQGDLSITPKKVFGVRRSA